MSRPTFGWLSKILTVGILGIGSNAAAEVRQPVTGEVMPQATSGTEIGIATSRGFPEDAITLEGLFKYRGEMLDPVADAKTAPGAFSPLCGFTGELVLRGGGCKVALGWYNVDPSGSPPRNDEIYVLVPADPTNAAQGLGCQDNDFCPLATMETTQTGQHGWTPRTYSAENIRTDPRYAGGLVGFALIGDSSQLCSQTKFSQAELNVKSSSGEPWVTTLIYQSTATPDAFYIAFEDLPMSQMSWRSAQNGGGGQNDGDFNDFVFFVTGLTCQGAGQPCETGLQGACAAGLTDCSDGGGPPACRPAVQPTAERCDNVDNDCNGMVDDGEGLCPEGRHCFQGKCVANCRSGEFMCPGGFQCNDAGFCIDVACQGVQCGEGEVCVGGTCRGACDGVVCPLGQECQLGRCVDLCAGVTCEGNKVCERGICVQNCSCRGCGDDKRCHPDGRCVDIGCETQTCGEGQVCVAGTCRDACEGAMCPGNAECVLGQCGDPPLGSVPGAGDPETGGSGPDIIITPPTGSGGTPSLPPPTQTGGGGNPGTSTVSPPPPPRRGAASGSSCQFSGTAASHGVLGLGLLALAGFAWRRRRRSNLSQ
ncbi:MAG: putative metal-binding motif-containing protein [Pseudomonadota bacterium]|nr:MAG: hypothetical protein DIU78_00585 [Pseudomonadota bacterium]